MESEANEVDPDEPLETSRKSKVQKDEELPLDAHALEIQYQDPIHGLPCRENIFIDRNDPTRNSRAPRLLVSVESVNMLRQSLNSAENKLQMVRDALNSSRIAFFHELQHLRQILLTLAASAPTEVTEKVAAAMNEEASDEQPEQAKDKSPQETYQVYFFRVEEYLDDRAMEHAKKVIEKVRKQLELEIEVLEEQIRALGGKGNKQILVLCLQSGATYKKITEDLCKFMVNDDIERRAMENSLTDGLRDKLDYLVQREERMLAQLEEAKARLEELEEVKFQQHRQIEELRAKVKDAREQFSELKDENEKVTYQKGSLEREVEQLKKTAEIKMAAEKHALQKEREEIEETHKTALFTALEAEKAANEAHQEVCGRLAGEEGKPKPVEEDHSEKMQAIEIARRRVEEANAMRDQWATRLENAEASKAKSQEKISDLSSQLGPLNEELHKAPPPDPRLERYEQIQEQLKTLADSKQRIHKEIEHSNKSMGKLQEDIRLRKKIAGVQADSDDEEEEGGPKHEPVEPQDPAMDDYRERRKIATFGKKKFDIGSFLHDDGESRRRRSMKQISEHKKAHMKNLLRVLNANAGIQVEDEEILAECDRMFGKDSAVKFKDGEEESSSVMQLDPLQATWPHGVSRPGSKENAQGQQETTPDQQADILERRIMTSERRATEAQRRLDAATWTSSRLQDLMNDLGSKLQNALSEERALREELPKAVQRFLATLPAELSRGEIESLLAQYQQTMEELRSLEDAVGEAAALIEGQDAVAQKEGSPNGDLAACRVRFEEHAQALRESINSAVYAAKDLSLMNELMAFIAKVDNVIMNLVKHQDARAELAAEVLQVSEAMQKEQQLEEEMLMIIQTEEARQRSLALDLHNVSAAFSRDISDVPTEQSEMGSSRFAQEALMDHSPERMMGLDSRASSPPPGESPGSSPDGLPALRGRGSGDGDAFESFGFCASNESAEKPRRTARNLRRAAPGKPHTMDFGFRQDGEGEESLENWALFKVTKSPDQKDHHGGTGGSRRRPMAAFPRELRICHSEPKLRQNHSAFRDYILKHGLAKPGVLDAHTRSSVWGTSRHRHSLPVIAGVAAPAS